MRYVQKTILDFADDGELKSGLWSPLTDQVRGGKSTAFIRFDADTAEISGELTLIENAGFASYRVIRSTRDGWDFGGKSAISIEASGDGRTYKVLLKDEAAKMSDFEYSWECELPTTPAGAMQTKRMSFDSFVATCRGRPLRDVPALELSTINQIGIQINDKIPGPYGIRLRSFVVD